MCGLINPKRMMFGLLLTLFVGLNATASAGTLEDIRMRGKVACGIDEQNYGFAYLNDQGVWQGFEVDYCRALAVAIFADDSRVKFLPLNAQTRFSALANGDVDVLLRSTTWTYSRDMTAGFDFPGVTYYDELGMLAHKSIGVESLAEVDNSIICVAAGTTTQEVVQEYVENTDRNLSVKLFNSREGMNNFFFSGQCDIYTADLSALKAVVAANAPRPQDYVFLSASLSKEPLGPVVRDDDKRWYEIVKWMVHGLVEAEEKGVSSENVSELVMSNNKRLRFLLGENEGFGEPLGLRDEWLRDVLEVVGNYGEIFERHLGKSGPLKMERGRNALWKNGGMMYAIPIR